MRRISDEVVVFPRRGSGSQQAGVMGHSITVPCCRPAQARSSSTTPWTSRITRFGKHRTHELGIQPEAYDPKLDVDFTPLSDQDPAAAGFGQAA